MPINPSSLGAIYQSPPNSGSNDGALPTVYDPNWNLFQNLTQAQVLAFQAFPQDLIRYVHIHRWRKEMVLIDALRSPYDDGSTVVTLPPLGQLVSALIANIQATRTALNQAMAGINATPQTITERAQIDALFP